MPRKTNRKPFIPDGSDHDARIVAHISRVEGELAELAVPHKPPPGPKKPTQSSSQIAARLFRGRQEGARKGRHQGGPAPYGYRRVKRALVPRPQEDVSLIYTLYLKVGSILRVIAALEERGIRTRRGGDWSRAGISWILRNDTYCGITTHGPVKVKGTHEALVSRALFGRVQAQVKLNTRNPRKSRAPE